MTENDHEARQLESTARRRRLWCRLVAVGLLVVLGLGAGWWWLFYRPLSSEERPLVGRWVVPHYEEKGNGTYEWEFRSNRTVRRRVIKDGTVQPATENVLSWSVSDGKLKMSYRHHDWVARLKSGNTSLTESGDGILAWDGPDRFSLAPVDQSGRVLGGMVLVRKPEQTAPSP